MFESYWLDLQMNKKLGRLEKIDDLRGAVWETEDRHFTPWLAQEENISLLGDTIGLSLEVEAQEQAVGPFRADILCRDMGNDSWVLIENQLERTDHTHLGQLMTYASGLKAVTIVWIAKKFTEEHRSSLDWLNEITDDTFNFFGLEIELWKIGDSSIAPKFNVVSKPNDWSRLVAAASKSTSLTETKLRQGDYWKTFSEFLVNNNSNLKTTKPRPQNWMNLPLKGKAGIGLVAIASNFNSETNTWSGGENRAELYIDGASPKSYFNQLYEKKEEIESIIGEEGVWQNLENKKSCKVYLVKAVQIKDDSDWGNQHQWLMEKLALIAKAFRPHLSTLIDD